MKVELPRPHWGIVLHTLDGHAHEAPVGEIRDILREALMANRPAGSGKTVKQIGEDAGLDDRQVRTLIRVMNSDNESTLEEIIGALFRRIEALEDEVAHFEGELNTGTGEC